MSEVTKCRECGGYNLYWSQCNSNKTGIAEGRLRTHEVTCSFVLGCEDCSETMVVIGADTFIAKHVAAQSELAKSKRDLENWKRKACEAAEREAALREELANAYAELRNRCSIIAASVNESDNLSISLAAAEKRNANLTALLQRVIYTGELSEPFYEEFEAEICTALKPTESGASE